MVAVRSTYITLDRAAMPWTSSESRPMICAHSFTAMTIISAVMVVVSLFVSDFFSSAVFLVPTRRARRGITSSATRMVRTIQRTNVMTAVTPAELSGSPRVLGNMPKNLL